MVLQHIPDVTGPQTQCLCGNHRSMGGDKGIVEGQEQVSGTGRPPCDAEDLALGNRTRFMVKVHPFRHVGQEHPHQRGFGYHGLVVAQVGQAFFQAAVADFQHRIQHHVAGCG
ncbi:hypothetical protein SDC9_177364 [bioreactor metagenome]|uniref:Uncharacterized protein n=1 Tax=bioreactor metagenome TaxID=1076179 RepID=A0A645GUA4_9ZZZZ